MLCVSINDKRCYIHGMFQVHQCIKFKNLQIPNYHHQDGDHFHNPEKVSSFFPVKLHLPFIEHLHLLILVSITQVCLSFYFI